MKYFRLVVPFLLAFASLLQLNYVASMAVSPDQVLRPLIILCLLLALLVWPAYWITRDWTWTAILLSVLVIGLFFSTDLFTTFLLFMLLAGALWLGYSRLRRKRLNAQDLLAILAIAGAFVTGIAFLLAAAKWSQIDWLDYRRDVRDARNFLHSSLTRPENPPDIYYIILDGYARSDILQEFYRFDNSEFITYLEQKGFVVPTSNQSNYPATPLSIASTLNMDYIQRLMPSLGENDERWLMSPLIDHSRIRAILEAQGYQSVSLSSNWTITENTTTDLYLHAYPVMLSDFEKFILAVTPLKFLTPLLGNQVSLPDASSHRQVIRFNFKTMAELPRIPGPKFVFIHIISPHPPFLFDKDGNPLDIGYPFTFRAANEYPGSLREYPKKYRDQVQFVNHQLETAIDAILAGSETPPVILLQADHGSGLMTNLASAEKTCIHERYSPFAAYYLPHADKSKVPNDISNVNLFRMVLNEYFDAELPLLGNRQYFYRDTRDYYEFEDVSGRSLQKCSLPDP